MKHPLKLGVIGGGGWLAQTIIKSLIDKNVLSESQLGVSYRSNLPGHFTPALATKDSQKLVDACDTIILSVRPADFQHLTINAAGKLVVSVMAGISIEKISQNTHATRVIRAMPNVAASVGYSYTPLVASAAATTEDRDLVKTIFTACGLCDEVAHESHLDYLTGLTGSGPAYPALLAVALSADAINRGIAPGIARRAVSQLLVGTGRLLEHETKSMDDIVQEFVDYRGVIAAAITSMRASGFDASVQAGLAAATEKVKALA